MPVDKHQLHLPLAVAQPRPRTLAGSDRNPPERALPQRVAGMDQVALLDRPHTFRIVLSWTGEPVSAPIRTFATVRPA